MVADGLYNSFSYNVISAAASGQRVGGRPSHPHLAVEAGGDPVGPRLQPKVHADGLADNEGGLQAEQLRDLLRGGHLQGARLQHHVRTLRRNDPHVLLPQQAHHDRHRHWQQ